MEDEKLEKGFEGFVDQHGELAQELAENGQNPDYLFIACMDSRSAPEHVFNLDPGDSFTDRPMGGILLPYEEGDKLSIQNNARFAFAAVKGAEKFVLMGHTECGFAEGVAGEVQHPQITPWLDMGRSIREQAARNLGTSTAAELQPEIERLIPIVNLQNAMTYPAIQELVAANKIEIGAFLYNLKEQAIYRYNPEEGQYEPYVGNDKVDQHACAQGCTHGDP